MKALSLRQPWPELILQGRKIIETRTWNTSYRGNFYIHASGKTNKEEMEKHGFKKLPRGKVVGIANLIDTKPYPTENDWKADNEKHLAGHLPYNKKHYGFILTDVKRIKPKPCKGQLGFFTLKNS